MNRLQTFIINLKERKENILKEFSNKNNMGILRQIKRLQYIDYIIRRIKNQNSHNSWYFKVPKTALVYLTCNGNQKFDRNPYQEERGIIKKH